VASKAREMIPLFVRGQPRVWLPFINGTLSVELVTDPGDPRYSIDHANTHREINYREGGDRGRVFLQTSISPVTIQQAPPDDFA
jgi:hypothetical protein